MKDLFWGGHARRIKDHIRVYFGRPLCMKTGIHTYVYIYIYILYAHTLWIP